MTYFPKSTTKHLYLVWCCCFCFLACGDANNTNTTNKDKAETDQPTAKAKEVKVATKLPEGMKRINFYDQKFPMPLTCVIPDEAKVKDYYDSHGIDISARVSIDDIERDQIYHLNDETKKRGPRTLKEVMEQYKGPDYQPGMLKNFKIIEETDDGFVGVGDGIQGKTYLHRRFLATDEYIYQIKAAPMIAYTDEEKAIVEKVIASFELQEPCFAPIKPILPDDQIMDFRKYGFSLKMAVPAGVNITADHMGYEFKVPLGEHGEILISDYVFGNDLEKSLPNKIKDIEKDEDFVAFLHKDDHGYLAKMKPNDFDVAPFKGYYFHRSDELYYAMKIYWPNYKGNTKQPMVDEATVKEAYERIKQAVVGKRCE